MSRNASAAVPSCPFPGSPYPFAGWLTGSTSATWISGGRQGDPVHLARTLSLTCRLTSCWHGGRPIRFDRIFLAGTPRRSQSTGAVAGVATGQPCRGLPSLRRRLLRASVGCYTGEPDAVGSCAGARSVRRESSWSRSPGATAKDLSREAGDGFGTMRRDPRGDPGSS